MRNIVQKAFVVLVTILFLVIFVGMAYYVGKPVMEGIKQMGWPAVMASIAAGALVGLVVYVFYNLPPMIVRIWRKRGSR